MSELKLPLRKGEHVRDATDDPGFGEVCLDEYWRILDADGAEVCRANTEPIADDIVRAVNSHAALVEACRKVSERLMGTQLDFLSTLELVETTNAALALAEPDQKEQA